MEWSPQDVAVTIAEDTTPALPYLDQLPYSLSIQPSMSPQGVYLQPSSVELDFLDPVTTTQDDTYYDTAMWNGNSSQIDAEIFLNIEKGVLQPPDFAPADSGDTEAKNSIASNASSGSAKKTGNSPVAKTKKRSERRKEQNRHAQRLYRERKEQQLRDATECLHAVSQELFDAQSTIKRLEAELKTSQDYPREMQQRNESLLKQLSEAEDRNKALDSRWAALRSKLQEELDNM